VRSLLLIFVKGQMIRKGLSNNSRTVCRPGSDARRPDPAPGFKAYPNGCDASSDVSSTCAWFSNSSQPSSGGLIRNNAPTSEPTIPTASSGGVFARKTSFARPYLEKLYNFRLEYAN
jgi:hypothetical protein